MKSAHVLLAAAALLASGCGDYGPGAAAKYSVQKVGKPPMTLSSPAFTHGGMIPDRYSCVSENLSPPLEWNNAPDNARSFALIMRDADAGHKRYVHWVLPSIPGDRHYLSEGAGNRVLAAGDSTRCGGYFGVVPYKDYRLHRYIFTLYALDTVLPPDSTPFEIERLENLTAGHVLAKAELVGRFGRSQVALPRFW